MIKQVVGFFFFILSCRLTLENKTSVIIREGEYVRKVLSTVHTIRNGATYSQEKGSLCQPDSQPGTQSTTLEAGNHGIQKDGGMIQGYRH